MNDRPFAVARNLFEAMHSLRQEWTPITIWIDAICINQDDMEERSHQVGMMRDIYQKASRIIVWLGPKSTYSDKAMVLLHELNIDSITEQMAFAKVHGPTNNIFSLRKFVVPRPIAAAVRDESLPAPYDNESWEGIAELFHREWFSRMWTLQEIVLANDAVFMCGDKEIALWELNNAASLINIHNAKPHTTDKKDTVRLELSGYRVIIDILMTRDDYIKTGKLELMGLLTDCWNRKSSDPRDRIYGLLGLVEELSISINYQSPVIDVYRAFAEVVITSYKSLNILRMKHYPSVEGLPSWVPDWSTVSKQNPPSRAGLYHGAANSKAKQFFGKSGSLTAQGIAVDAIEFIGAEASITEIPIYGGFHLDWEYMVHGIGDLNGSFDTEVLKVMRSRPYISGGSKLEAFARTLVADRWSDQRWSQNASVAVIRDLWEIKHALIQPEVEHRKRAEVLSAQFEDDIARFDISLLQECRHRRLFITVQGYMGLAPPTAREGDLVCVLLGGDVPFILRPSNSNYSLIGESYGTFSNQLNSHLC